MDLATHKAVKQLEGEEGLDMKEYSDAGSGRYAEMVEQIRKNLNLTTLNYQKLDDLVIAIGLPKEKLCTHCWDGSSYE
jgi:amidophosphoribosyltransferase